MEKKKNKILIALLMLFMVAMIPCRDTNAASKINNLEAGKTYRYDLDQDGKKEQIKYELTDAGKYIIYINGKVKKTVNLGDWYYEPQLQVMDIDKKDGYLDIWAYCYRDSEDIGYSALYRYNNKKLSRVWNLAYDPDSEGDFQQCSGYICSTDGTGSFTVVMDRTLHLKELVGNHWDRVKYRIKDNKVTRVSKKEFYFERTLALNDDYKDESLICAKKTRFYRNHTKKDGTFTVKKGTKVYPVKAYIASENVLYVQYKTKSGTKGWLCTSDYDWDEHPFTNILLAD